MRIHIGIGRQPLTIEGCTSYPLLRERVMAALEGLIRRCPTQYLWLHQRFKRQPDGSKRRYG